MGYRLAGEPSAEHVDRLDGRPVDAGDVAEVGHVGVAVGEDAAGAGVHVGHPGGGAAEYGVDALLEAAAQ